MNKTVTKAIERGTPLASRPSRTSSPGQAHPGMSAAPSLGAAIGNQVLLQLLESGLLQAKLRVSQPGDPDEREADHVADQVVAAAHAPKIQRKCACEGTGNPCAKCEEEETGTIHRSVASPSLRSSQLAVQRAPASDSSAKTPDQAGNPPRSSPTPAHTHPLVVEDDAKSVGPHQMRKSAFIALLRSDACATADAVLISVGHTTKSCPYIEKWLAFYEKQSADHIERAILKYAPETAHARSAHEAIRLVVMRVQRAAMTWAKTGKVTGLPEDLASQLPGQGFLGAVHSFASSTVGGAILGFLGGSKPEKSAADTATDKSPAATVSRKASDGHPGVAPARDAGAVRSQLGAGHSLDSRAQSQMSSAFGHDFSGVRIHTDAKASALSSDLNARAFTIGTDVAFASGEYRPGTPVGDALIAHELAHVVQQSAATRSPSPMQKAADGAAGATDHGASQLENDADLSAVGAVASLWAGAKRGLADLRANAIPRLRSGLRLQRCAHQAVQARTPVLETLRQRFDRHEITEDDLANSTVKQWLHALSKAKLRDYRGQTKDPAVQKYIDRLVAISTPVPAAATFDETGTAHMTIGNVQVVIKPDIEVGHGVLGAASRTSTILEGGDLRLRTTGDRKTLHGFTQDPYTLTVQTKFSPGVSASDASGYGRGTTPEDIAAHETSLGFHEGSHGTVSLDFVRQHPPPTFGGTPGMTRKEYEAATAKFHQDFDAYAEELGKASTLRVDCVGKTINEYFRENRKRLRREDACPQP